MRSYTRLLTALVLTCSLAGCGNDAGGTDGKTAGTGSGEVTYYFGARIIPGDGSPAMDDMSFIVTGGKFTTVGPFKEVLPPKGASRIELTGRTITPVFVNLAAQPGMNAGKVYGSKNYTRDSVTADISRYAYYGVMGILTAGTDAGDLAFSVRDELREGRIKGARLFTAGQGIAAKGGGPQGLADTTIQVSGAADAKRAVTDLADKKVDAIRLWMDDGNGKGAKLKPEMFTAAIEEAHKQKLKVFAQVFALNDAKELVKAGVDGFVSSIRDTEVDDALIAEMKAKNVLLAPALTSAEAKFVYADKPDWLGEQTMREVYPAQLAGYLLDPAVVSRFNRNSELSALRQQYAMALKNLKKLSDGGVRIGLGTNSGAADTYPGYFELREMIAMTDAGMKPMDVIKAATSVSAAALGIDDLGTIAVGKTADFLAMPNNPLEKMTNIKDVGSLYLNGVEQERSALIQDIRISTEGLRVTQKERAEEEQAQKDAAAKAAEDKLPHYGKFVLGNSVSVRYLSVPTPKGSKFEVKAGPPDRITVSLRGATAAELREFYSKALPAYRWAAAGNCWSREHPSSKKLETLCVEAANNSAVIQIAEK
jgi:imidazolonepropionase-like amidohydrolase